MKNLRDWLIRRWRFVTLCSLAIAVVILLLVYKLGSLAHGLSTGEIQTQTAVLSWHNVSHNPLYLPLKIVKYLTFTVFPHHGQTLTRLPSALFGGLAFLATIRLFRIWYGTRSMLYGAVLLACSAAFLHASRLASPDVLYILLIPAILVIITTLQRFSSNRLVFYSSPFLLGLLLYIPGAIWLVAICVWWYRYELLKAWKHFNKWWQRAIWFASLLFTLSLLLYAGIAHPSLLLTWLGLPQHWASPLQLLINLILVPVHVFLRGPHLPEIWLARLPQLDIFVTVMVLMGGYFYARHWQASRSLLLACLIAVGTILIALGGPVSLSLLLPLMYILAVGGISYLLHDWLTVFPRNPLARSFGLALIAVAITLSCFYNLRSYFVAWPHNTDTIKTFRHRS